MIIVMMLLLKGFVIGLSIAMPVGPIGLLCIQNSLARGMIYGLLSGLGAACADTLYGALGGFGVSAVGMFLAKYRLILEILGSLFLCYLGAFTFSEKIVENAEITFRAGYSRAFFSTFLLTLTNPMTILSFAGIYAGLGMNLAEEDLWTPLITTLGIFVGSAFWWLILSAGSSCFKEKMNAAARKWLNRTSGTIIFVFGISGLTFVLITFLDY
jgi:threonine/homoserine/homoserine lactone efflux protein